MNFLNLATYNKIGIKMIKILNRYNFKTNMIKIHNRLNFKNKNKIINFKTKTLSNLIHLKNYKNKSKNNMKNHIKNNMKNNMKNHMKNNMKNHMKNHVKIQYQNFNKTIINFLNFQYLPNNKY